MLEKIKKRPLYKKHKEKIKFAMVGGVNTVIDFVIFGMLANVFGVVTVGANIISTTICMIISFWLNYTFVWQSKKSKLETAPKFVIVSAFSAWVVQSVAIWMIVSIFGGEDVVNLGAKVVGVGCGMVSNYLGYKFIFK